MKNISEFFKKIGAVHAKEMALRASIQSSIKKFTEIDIPATSILFKSGVVTFKSISHSARSVIYIHKQKIIDQINNEQSVNKVTNIR